MFTVLSTNLFVKFFPHVAKCMARRRAARYAEQEVRRRQALFFRPRLEDLEERIVPDAYTFVNPLTGLPSNGSFTVGANWTDLSNAAKNGTVPGANDTADVPTGASCTVTSGASPAVQGLTVEGSLSVAGALTIAASGLGTGATSVAATGATLTIGSSNSSATPSFVTNSLTDVGTITVGSSSASGATASLDAVFADIHTGILNIGDPGSGTAGTVDISKTMSLSGGTLNVGGAGGSGGTLGAYVLTASQASIVNVNEHGQMNIEDSATLGGTTTVSGGVITAENIDGFSGASITISGTADVTSGPLLGNLVAGANASFTFAPFSTVTLGTGATLGNGQFYIDGTLNVNEDLEATLSEFTVQDSAALIDGSGSIDWWNQPFNWEGGTIGGLSGGGFTIDGNSRFQTSGSATKTLATDMTNLGNGTAEFDGTGTLVIDGPGMPDGDGALNNLASGVVPMEMSLPLVMGIAGNGGTPGTFTNSGYVIVNASDGLTISAPLDNTADGDFKCETVAGPLTLSDDSGTSILNGAIELNSDTLTISGDYTSTTGLSVDNSDGTTLTGKLTLDSGANDDISTLILAAGEGGGGLITGAGNLELTGNITWEDGDITGSGGLTLGATGNMQLVGLGMLSRNLSNEGKVEWLAGSEFTFGSGTVVSNEYDSYFSFTNSFPGSIPTFDNDGTLEVGAGDTLDLGTFAQTSDGTLQCDLASDSSYAAVNVSGTATLDGTLDGNLQNGYQPPSGTSFDVLNFASSSGQFATVDPSNWSAQYNSTSVDLVSS